MLITLRNSRTAQSLKVAVLVLLSLSWTVNTRADSNVTLESLKPHQSFQVPLSLDQAIAFALKNNAQYRLAELSKDSAARGRIIARANYDPTVFYDGSRNESTSHIVDSESDTHRQITHSSGVSGVLPSGLSYRASMNSTALDNSPADQEVDTTGYQFEFRQPLLRGLGIGTHAPVLLAKQSAFVAELEADNYKNLLIRDVTNAYVDTYVAKEYLLIAQRSAKLAENVLHEEEQRFELGKAASSSVYRPKAAISQRQGAIFQAARTYEASESYLKNLIFSGRASENQTLMLDAPDLDFDDYVMPNVKAVLAKRADYQSLIAQLASNKISLKHAKRNRLPQLDVVARYSDTNNEFSTVASGNVDEVEGTYIGLSFSMPIANRQARQRVNQEKIAVQSGKLKVRAMEEQVRRDLSLWTFHLESNRAQMASAKMAVEQVKKALSAEEQKMAVGRSSSFYILDLQTQLAVAEQQQLFAYASYLKSIAELTRLIGA